MKTAVLAGCVAAAFATGANAEIMYVGSAAVTAASTACGNSATVGDYARITYRPAYPAFGNSGDSYLAYVTTRASFAMTVPANTFRAGINYSGQSVGSTLNVASRAGGITAWTQAPATPATDTSSINVTATFANFWTISGCTVSLRFNLLRVKSGPDEVLN
ncbi:hypothetical protein [Methylopila turkensis]|uniref:Uncharacterized protein n=1 Tax=Methylopila turkensis TaxID=1437816 RepID=A0A9W6JQ22_9HYPH|nr:hypothetical protein [Methylopila turkensis]GLK79553.1 hypothetical protein GCM10008174_12940 [Methylopila turkensis]